MSNTIILKGAKLYDGTDKQVLEHSVLVIKDGIITAVGPDQTIALPSEGKIIDVTNKFIIPGLIDSHIHFFQSAGLYTRPDGLDLRHKKSYKQEMEDINKSIPELFKRYLACGITAVVDCGGPIYNFEIEKLSKTMLAPHVSVAGPLASTVSREKLDIGDAPIVKVTTEAEIDTIVKKCHEKNPVFMKIWFIYQPDQFEEDSKRVKLIIEKSKALGMRVAVHATELETARRAVQYGTDILVHSVWDKILDKEFITLLKMRNVIYIPTLMVRKGYRDVFRTRLELSDYEQTWGDPAVIKTFRDLLTIPISEIPETHRYLVHIGEYDLPDLESISLPNLKLLADGQVTVSAGTDAGNVGTLHGPSLHYELEMMVKAGLTPLQVLKTVTKNAAKVLNRTDIGTLEVGKIADLVILEKDPTIDIKNTRTINQVMRNGILYKPDELVKPTYITDVVNKEIEAYNNRDIEAFVACYHPKAQIIDLKTGKKSLQGINEIYARYKALFMKSPQLHVTIENRIVQGSMVIDHEYVQNYQGTGEVRAVIINEVKNHLITRVWSTRG